MLEEILSFFHPADGVLTFTLIAIMLESKQTVALLVEVIPILDDFA